MDYTGACADTASDYYVVINLDREWLMYAEQRVREMCNTIYYLIAERLHGEYNLRDAPDINVVYEMGRQGMHPHLNITMVWDGYELTEGSLRRFLERVLNDGVDIPDMVISEIYDHDGLITYLNKEPYIKIGYDFDQPGPSASGFDLKPIDDGRKKPHAMKVTELKQQVQTLFTDGKIKTRNDLQMHFFSKGKLAEFTTFQQPLEAFLAVLQSCTQKSQLQNRIDSTPDSSAMYWFHVVANQPEGPALLNKFAQMTVQRDTAETGQQGVMLLGRHGVGKTWLCAWLHHNQRAGMINLSDHGVGRWQQVLEHDVIIIDDPPDNWMKADRTTILHLLAGTPFSIKVHSSTVNSFSPSHVVICCQKWPTDLRAELERRLVPFHIVHVRQGTSDLPVLYNYGMVFKYLDNNRTDISQGIIPCMCGTVRNSSPCYIRNATSEYKYCEHFAQ